MNNVARPQMRNRFAPAPVAAGKEKDEVEDLLSNARLLAACGALVHSCASCG